MAKNTARETFNGQMDRTIKEIFLTTISKGMESTYGLMGGSIKVNGRKIKWMEKE
jgi:hypothetical protein